MNTDSAPAGAVTACVEGKYRKAPSGVDIAAAMVEIQRKLLRERALLRQWEKNSWVGGGGGGGG